jgi:hypothetical protein
LEEEQKSKDHKYLDHEKIELTFNGVEIPPKDGEIKYHMAVYKADRIFIKAHWKEKPLLNDEIDKLLWKNKWTSLAKEKNIEYEKDCFSREIIGPEYEEIQKTAKDMKELLELYRKTAVEYYKDIHHYIQKRKKYFDDVVNMFK